MVNINNTNVNDLTADQLDAAARTLKWGTYGITGREPRQEKRLVDLATDHLEAILVTQKHISHLYSKVILHIIKSRLST